jgi:hypothetical protein
LIKPIVRFDGPLVGSDPKNWCSYFMTLNSGVEQDFVVANKKLIFTNAIEKIKLIE